MNTMERFTELSDTVSVTACTLINFLGKRNVVPNTMRYSVAAKIRKKKSEFHPTTKYRVVANSIFNCGRGAPNEQAKKKMKMLRLLFVVR